MNGGMNGGTSGGVNGGMNGGVNGGVNGGTSGGTSGGVNGGAGEDAPVEFTIADGGATDRYRLAGRRVSVRREWPDGRAAGWAVEAHRADEGAGRFRLAYDGQAWLVDRAAGLALVADRFHIRRVRLN